MKKRKFDNFDKPIFNDTSEITHLLNESGELKEEVVSFIFCLFRDFIKKEHTNLYNTISNIQLSQIIGELLSKKSYWSPNVVIPRSWKKNYDICVKITYVAPYLCFYFDSNVIWECVKLHDFEQTINIIKNYPIDYNDLMNLLENSTIIKEVQKYPQYFSHVGVNTPEMLELISINGWALRNYIVDPNYKLLYIKTALKQNPYVAIPFNIFDYNIILEYPQAWIYMDTLSQYKSATLTKLLTPDNFSKTDYKLIKVMTPSCLDFDVKLISYYKSISSSGERDIEKAMFNISTLLYKYNKILYFGFPDFVKKEFNIMYETPSKHIKELKGVNIYYMHIEKLTDGQIYECIEYLDISNYDFNQTRPMDLSLEKYTWIFPVSKWDNMSLTTKTNIASLFEKKLKCGRMNLSQKTKDIYFNFK